MDEVLIFAVGSLSGALIYHVIAGLFLVPAVFQGKKS
jgi:hypothetical protein